MDNHFSTPSGSDTTLALDGTTTYTADSYVADSASKGSSVVTGPATIAWNSTVSTSNYSYATAGLNLDANGNFKFDGNTVITTTGTKQLSAGAVGALSGKYEFSEYNTQYTTAQTIAKDSALTIDATKYVITQGSENYHLDSTGTKLLNTAGDEMTGEDYKTSLEVLKAAYNLDKTRLESAKTTVNSVNKTNEDNYNTADSFYDSDSTKKSNLATYKASLDTANSAYSTNKSNYDKNNNGYTTIDSLGEAIDLHITDALQSDGTGLIYNAVTTSVTDLITTKEALLSADIGYNLADPDNATTGLVARLDALTEESTDKTLVGAINTNTRAIVSEAQTRASEDARVLREANAYTDVRFNQLDHKIDRLEDKMEKGLAANAALAGLTPLSSEHKTQLSAAMGGYGSNQAVAVGAYHYVTDSTLLNAGAAYGGNSDVSYKVGVTFGF